MNDTHPDPVGADPVDLARWTLIRAFPFTRDERWLLLHVIDSGETQAPLDVQTLYELRILFWQVVGWTRRN